MLAPGVVATPQFRVPPVPALSVDDIAGAVMYAISQPVGVEVNDLSIRPSPPRGTAPPISS